MGGGDKSLLDVAGKPMLAHVIQRLSSQVQKLAINANGDPERFSAFGLPVVPDTVSGFVGPLAGVLAGMRWSRANAPEVHWIATAAGDAPLLPEDLVARLLATALERSASVVFAQSYGEVHPVIGLWSVALADDLNEQLLGGVRKVLRWSDRHASAVVEFAPVRIRDRELDPFYNANTPHDLDLLRSLLAAQ
jgi:molybdopterin-guanine dinucleotide biosynthesis protein A